MTDKGGGKITAKEGHYSPGTSASGAVDTKGTLNYTGQQKFGNWDWEQPVKNPYAAEKGDSGPSNIKQSSFFFLMLSHNIILNFSDRFSQPDKQGKSCLQEFYMIPL